MAAFSYNYLPGTQVTTIDGGLVVRTIPTAKSVLVLGTSAQGPANEPYPVTNRATSAQVFGLSGSLIRAQEEVAIGGCDNIILYRIGSAPATLANVGASTGSISVSGFTITFGSVDATVSTDYSIWYKTGVLYVWNGTQLVYANDTYNEIVVDTGDLTISSNPDQGLGMQFGTGSVGSLSSAITVAAAAAQSPTSHAVQAVFTPAVLGTGLTGRQLYIALAQALELLDVYPVDEVVAPDVIFDNPGVAFHPGILGNEANDVGGVNDPTINPNALDWLKTTTDAYGNTVYQWASESTDSNGNSVTPMQSLSPAITTPAERIAAGFYEVCFPHLLATWCQKQETIGLQGTCLLFIGTSQPAGFKLTQLRTWVGYIPIYNPLVVNQVGDADIQVTTDGGGLFGNPYMAGCTAARLNYLCSDYATGRSAGLFITDNGTYDGEVVIDANGNPTDAGAYVHVVADLGILANGYSSAYAANLANYAAGYVSVLDEASGLTNKPVSASQLWTPNSVILNNATQLGFNFLRFKGAGNLPVFLHDQTAATDASDYKNLLRQRIKGLVVDTVRTTADPFIGSSSLDGLQLTAFQAALTKNLMTLQTRGYISSFKFSVTTTAAQQRIGHANVDVTFNPADELVQLDASVAVSRSA
jgi:hypothetical protein